MVQRKKTKATKPSPYLDPCINLGKYPTGAKSNTEVKKNSKTEVPRTSRINLPILPASAPKFPRGNRCHPRKKLARKRTVCDALREMGDGSGGSWRTSESEQSSVLKQFDIELDRVNSFAKLSPYLPSNPLRSTYHITTGNGGFLIPEFPDEPFNTNVEFPPAVRDSNETITPTSPFTPEAERAESRSHFQTPVFFDSPLTTFVRSDVSPYHWFMSNDEPGTTKDYGGASSSSCIDEDLRELMQNCVIRKERHQKLKQKQALEKEKQDFIT